MICSFLFSGKVIRQWLCFSWNFGTICYWNHLGRCLSVLLLVCVKRFSSSRSIHFHQFLVHSRGKCMDGEQAHGPSVLYLCLHPSYPCFVLMSPVTAWCGLFISLYPKQLFLGHLSEPQQHNPYMGGPWNPLVLPRVFTGICFRRRPWAPGGHSYFFILPLHPRPPAIPCLVVRGATLEV